MWVFITEIEGEMAASLHNTYEEVEVEKSIWEIKYAGEIANNDATCNWHTISLPKKVNADGAFAHVADDKLRSILSAKNEDLDSGDDIEYALTVTKKAMPADNELLSDEIIAKRYTALEAAQYYWHYNGDGTNCIKNLRKFWNI